MMENDKPNAKLKQLYADGKAMLGPDPTSYAAGIEAAARLLEEEATRMNFEDAFLLNAEAAEIRALTPERGGGSGEAARAEKAESGEVWRLREEAMSWRRVAEAAEAKCRELEGQLRIITDLHNRELARNCELDDPTLPARIRELEGEVARLHERLEDNHAFDMDGKRIEMEPGSMPDGITCRDETIKLQHEHIARLEAHADRLTLAAQAAREALTTAQIALQGIDRINDNPSRFSSEVNTIAETGLAAISRGLASLASVPRGADRSEEITQTPSAGNTLAPKLSSEEITARGRVLADARSREALLDGGEG